MILIKFLFPFLIFTLTIDNLQAQKKCLSGDCYNGYGIVLKQNGDTVISDFTNGKVTNQVLVASKNHKQYTLINVTNTKWYLEKGGDSLRIGQGALINQKLVVDSSQTIYFLSKKGDLLSQLNNRIIHFTNDNLIKAYKHRTNDKSSRFDVSSNGVDYLFQNYENNIAVNGFLYSASSNKFIHFKIIDNKFQFFSDKDKLDFQAKSKFLTNFSLGGFDEYYFDNFENQRTIADLEQYISKLKNTLLKPLNDFNKIVEHAKNEYKNFQQQPQPDKTNNSQNTITLTYPQWTDLIKKEVIQVCKSSYTQAYEDFLFDSQLSGLPTDDEEVVYNISRDNGNKIIGLGELSSNNKVSFLVPAFKKAFSNLTKNNNYIVPNAVRKYYDFKTKKSYDFKLKLIN